VADGQASGVISRLESLRDGLGVPSRLRDLGIPEEALLDAAERGMGDWFLGGNPRPVKGADELREILSQAW
jgi:alcohol dehydrogenase